MSGEYFVSKAISLGFYEGATVEVTSIPVSEYVSGWDQCSTPDMASELGRQFVVSNVGEEGVTGSGTDYYWPWWSLKLVKKSPKLSPISNVPTEAYGPYKVGETAYVDGDKGKILGFDHEKNLIHLDLGDSNTYWFNYYDVSESAVQAIVKLNDEYTATVDFDNQQIVVGCQEIPFSAVLQLANSIKAGK